MLVDLRPRSLAHERLRHQIRQIFGKPLPPKSITTISSHYKILRPLAASGRVFLAHDTRLSRMVAIKPAPTSSRLDTKARFIREAILAASFNHRNIVTVYELTREQDVDWLVMEYVRGKRLDQLISRGKCSMQVAMDYAHQMTQALVALHSAGIVHRDLKPSNFVVTRTGTVKLIDFGLAKMLNNVTPLGKRAKSPRTIHGTLLGTPGYLSPEQVRGDRTDLRSDVFSFGAIFYELLSGRRAFCAPTSVETMNAILHNRVPKLPSSVPAPLVDIVERCLAKSPNKRYRTARELALSLDNHMNRI